MQQSPRRCGPIRGSFDLAKVIRDPGEKEVKQFIQNHLDSVNSSLSSESRAVRANMYTEVATAHERLAIEIEGIEHRLDYLWEDLQNLRHDMVVRKTGKEFMEAKFHKRMSEYEKKLEVLQEKRDEKHALLSSMFAAGQF
ncbi:hypothetical protein SCHPADRAFT_1000235 [Schizopora paradoxa]|uniref:Uncharacterized protein n=1 Tax=Schizopora paradoxa TaxID=27342 RepID=A0A0H2RC85_9AGAM|nr:hypothetical protein SCHPADRAFT_1000235 [Schizopora paradoxa]